MARLEYLGRCPRLELKRALGAKDVPAPSLPFMRWLLFIWLIVGNFAAGNYTAIARGKDDTTGIAVVQVYNLD